MYRRLSIENPFSFCGSACEPRSRPASHDGPGPAARMAVKDARSLRAAQRSSAARSLTATAAQGTSTWAGATRFILGRSRPTPCFGSVAFLCRLLRISLVFLGFARLLGDAQTERPPERHLWTPFTLIRRPWLENPAASGPDSFRSTPSGSEPSTETRRGVRPQ